VGPLGPETCATTGTQCRCHSHRNSSGNQDDRTHPGSTASWSGILAPRGVDRIGRAALGPPALHLHGSRIGVLERSPGLVGLRGTWTRSRRVRKVGRGIIAVLPYWCRRHERALCGPGRGTRRCTRRSHCAYHLTPTDCGRRGGARSLRSRGRGGRRGRRITAHRGGPGARGPERLARRSGRAETPPLDRTPRRQSIRPCSSRGVDPLTVQAVPVPPVRRTRRLTHGATTRRESADRADEPTGLEPHLEARGQQGVEPGRSVRHVHTVDPGCAGATVDHHCNRDPTRRRCGTVGRGYRRRAGNTADESQGSSDEEQRSGHAPRTPHPCSVPLSHTLGAESPGSAARRAA
jgi:hypothetical protein